MRDRGRLLLLMCVLALGIGAFAFAGVGVSAGVGGGAQTLTFQQGNPNDSAGVSVTILTNGRLGRLLQIQVSCKTRGYNGSYDFSGSLRIRRSRFAGRIPFERQYFDPTIDALTQPSPARGYLKARWASRAGPVIGTLSVQYCRGGRALKLRADAI